MGSTVMFAPGLARTLRHLTTIVVLATTAIMIYVAGQAAAKAGPAIHPAIVQVSSTTLQPGQAGGTYEMTITNLGDTTSVSVPAPVPAHTVTSASADTGTYLDGLWSITSLEQGATATLNLTAE